MSRSLDWMASAACAGTDPDSFFPEHKPGKGSTALQRRICGRCPVKTECGEHRKALGERRGIWAGKSYNSQK